MLYINVPLDLLKYWLWKVSIGKYYFVIHNYILDNYIFSTYSHLPVNFFMKNLILSTNNAVEKRKL